MFGAVFLSTLSLRRATCKVAGNAFGRGFLSTLSLRRATNGNLASHCRNNNFYPRSPCGERRRPRQAARRRARYFYPRSPCGERPYGRINDISRLIFLSTLSLRRATSGSKGRPATQAISIHALLAESDLIDAEIKIATERFLSTLSLRRATSKGSVSIPRYRNFYPRSPCGERPCPTISANTCF